MSTFERKYTDAQRDAMAHAFEDRRIRPARVVAEMAARGELEWNGERLEPFETNADTVRDLARDLRRRRAGEVTSQLSDVEPRSAIEQLRRRLVNVADAELQVEEKKKPGSRDTERLRQLARAIREAAAIPGPNEPRPAAPGQRKDGHREGGETKGGMAGAILAAHRNAATETTTARDEPAHSDRPPQERHAEVSEASTATDTHDAPNDEDDESPGACVRALADELGYV